MEGPLLKIATGILAKSHPAAKPGPAQKKLGVRANSRQRPAVESSGSQASLSRRELQAAGKPGATLKVLAFLTTKLRIFAGKKGYLLTPLLMTPQIIPLYPEGIPARRLRRSVSNLLRAI
jgi:hypothetical protein